MLWRPLVDVTRRCQYKLSKGSAPIGGGLCVGMVRGGRSSELRARARFRVRVYACKARPRNLSARVVRVSWWLRGEGTVTVRYVCMLSQECVCVWAFPIVYVDERVVGSRVMVNGVRGVGVRARCARVRRGGARFGRRSV